VTPNLLAKYEEMQGSTNDTSEFIELFHDCASQCKHVTEFGVRDVVSTWGFLAGLPEQLHSYDVIRSENVDEAEDLADQNRVFYYFHLQDVLEADIAEADLLFIDTDHTYKQLKAELARHASKVRKWILLHDTTLFGAQGADYGSGLNQAVNEFVRDNPQWVVKEKIESPWGLTILGKINE
jgi:hypothetical protein